MSKLSEALEEIKNLCRTINRILEKFEPLIDIIMEDKDIVKKIKNK